MLFRNWLNICEAHHPYGLLRGVNQDIELWLKSRGVEIKRISTDQVSQDTVIVRIYGNVDEILPHIEAIKKILKKWNCDFHGVECENDTYYGSAVDIYCGLLKSLAVSGSVDKHDKINKERQKRGLSPVRWIIDVAGKWRNFIVLQRDKIEQLGNEAKQMLKTTNDSFGSSEFSTNVQVLADYLEDHSLDFLSRMLRNMTQHRREM